MKFMKNEKKLSGSTNIRNSNARTSAPLVKVNLTYMKQKSDRINLVAPATPVDCLLY